MKTRHLATLLVLLILSATTHAVQAQAEEPSSTIKILGFEAQRAKMPNAKTEWTKLICKFSNSGDWVDGISFNYSVLVKIATGGSGDKFRLLAGGLTYMNVPRGTSEAILYLSPNATARFGTPVAALVEVFRGDRPLETFKWSSGGASPDADWATKYSPSPGILINVRATPWVIVDGERTPDLLIN